jgi:glycerol uptake facilitator-like aquaporin
LSAGFAGVRPLVAATGVTDTKKLIAHPVSHRGDQSELRGSPDSYLNPALTLGMAITSGDFSKFVPFVVAQILGGIVGAILVWLQFLPHWGVTEDTEKKLACFSTSPAIRNFGANLISEIISTFVLVMVIDAIFSKKVAAGGPVSGLGPFLVGVLVWAIGLSLGGTTGYAINPARDLGPRIAHPFYPWARKRAPVGITPQSLSSVRLSGRRWRDSSFAWFTSRALQGPND